jgi:hypothetical protein
VYTRDTGDWNGLGWEARALFLALLRKCDRAGILDVGKKQITGLASIVAMPEEVVARALPVLLEDGCLVANGSLLVVRNYIEAQESAQTDAQRSRERRARDRDRELSQNVTRESQSVTETTRASTDGHGEALRAVPSRAVPNSDPDHCPSGRPDGPLFLFPGDAAPQKKTKRNYSRGFLDFWQVYPRRVGKLRAWKLWPGDDILPAILAALEWQAKTESWNKDGGKFIPHPSTYLSQGRWEDEKQAGGDTSFAEALRIADERMGRKTP